MSWWILKATPGTRVSGFDREARLLAENDLKFNIASKLAHGDLQMIKNAIDSGTGTS